MNTYIKTKLLIVILSFLNLKGMEEADFSFFQNSINGSEEESAQLINERTPKVIDSQALEEIDLLLKKAGIKDFDVINKGINERNKHNETLLHKVALAGHVDIANLLIKNGADVNARDGEEWTPLHNAAERGHIDLVSLFIQHGALVDACDKYGCTPMHKAALYLHSGVMSILLSNFANSYMRNNQKETPLEIFARRKTERDAAILKEKEEKKNRDKCSLLKLLRLK